MKIKLILIVMIAAFAAVAKPSTIVLMFSALMAPTCSAEALDRFADLIGTEGPYQILDQIAGLTKVHHHYKNNRLRFLTSPDVWCWIG